MADSPISSYICHNFCRIITIIILHYFDVYHNAYNATTYYLTENNNSIAHIHNCGLHTDMKFTNIRSISVILDICNDKSLTELFEIHSSRIIENTNTIIVEQNANI